MHYQLGLTSQPDLCAISVQVQHSNRFAHLDQDALSIMCESENTFVAVMYGYGVLSVSAAGIRRDALRTGT